MTTEELLEKAKKIAIAQLRVIGYYRTYEDEYLTIPMYKELYDILIKML